MKIAYLMLSSVTLATKYETSRGVAKCRWCQDYFTGRSKTTKTKMTVNGVYSDHEDKDEDDHKDDHDRKLKLQ